VAFKLELLDCLPSFALSKGIIWGLARRSTGKTGSAAEQIYICNRSQTVHCLSAEIKKKTEDNK
jgi:hypothetical protein